MSPTPANLAAITDWVFDLDNTLYPANCSLFPQIDVRMRQFIAQHLDLDEAAAHALQKRYYREYGTTLRGLMQNNGIAPDQYLAFVHDIDHSVLPPAPRLDAALARLWGRKWIFTNGSAMHARRVLARLGIAQHFSDIFDIVAADFVPKPQDACYRAMLDRFGIRPETSAMVEDLERNLAPAHAIGMTTVWFRQDDHPDQAHLGLVPDQTGHVHHVTDDLTAWLETLTDAQGALSSPSTMTAILGKRP